MIKSFRIFLLLAGAVLAQNGLPQVKQADSTRIVLNEVDVTASRIPDNKRNAVRLTKIISHSEILASPSRDLAGLLESVPDLDVRQRGPYGVQADISFRGGSFDQTVILLNGINFNDPQTGHFQLDIPVPIALIKQIEILPGSNVKSLGANAFSGAINLVTGKPPVSEVQLHLEGGQYGYLNTGIGAGMKVKKFWQQGGAEFLRSDGYRINTDFRTINGFYQSGITRGKFDISLMAGAQSKAFGANSFYSPKYPGQYETTGSGLAALTAAWHGNVNISQSFYYRIHTDEFTLFRSDPPSWYTSPNYHLTQIAGSKTDSWFTSPLGKTAVGLEIRQESIWSTVLGEVTTETRPVFLEPGVQYNHFGSRTHATFSAEQQFQTGTVRWDAGVVFHEVKSVKSYFQVYPGLDMSVPLMPGMRAFGSFNRAFRLPTFTELYYKSPVQQGNPDLLPETAWQAEAGTELVKGGFTARLTGFYRFATQSVDWVRKVDETVWHTENLGKILTYGVETGLGWLPGRSGFAGKYIEKADLGFRYYFQHHQAGEYYSLYVLDYLKWKFTAGLTGKIGSRFRITANLIWQERNGTYTFYGDNNKPSEVDYKPFMLVDLKLSYKFKRLSFFASCSNLFNTDYFDLGGVPQPGTWFKAGFDLNLVGRN